jgi:hypothetical protein
MFLRKSAILVVLIFAGLVCAYGADITGKWSAQFDSQVGVQKYTFDFKVEGTKLTGTATSIIKGQDGSTVNEAKTQIQEGKIEGDKITFSENLPYTGMDLKIVYTGTVSGNEIKLSRTVADQPGETFVAKREK